VATLLAQIHAKPGQERSICVDGDVVESVGSAAISALGSFFGRNARLETRDGNICVSQETVNSVIETVTEAASSAADAIGDAASSAWGWVSSWWKAEVRDGDYCMDFSSVDTVVNSVASWFSKREMIQSQLRLIRSDDDYCVAVDDVISAVQTVASVASNLARGLRTSEDKARFHKHMVSEMRKGLSESVREESPLTVAQLETVLGNTETPALEEDSVGNLVILYAIALAGGMEPGAQKAEALPADFVQNIMTATDQAQKGEVLPADFVQNIMTASDPARAQGSSRYEKLRSLLKNM